MTSAGTSCGTLPVLLPGAGICKQYTGLAGESGSAEARSMGELLKYEQVEISYRGLPVVRDVSFSLREGEILGVVGEMGPAGAVTQGDILYRGRSLPALTAEELRRVNGPEIGMIFQNSGSSFCPVRTVGAQLYESAAAHGKVSKQDFTEHAVDLLQKIGFEDGKRILDSYPFELSGGMQQRVGIAAAMLLKPSILLADEPTSALDVFVQKQVVEEMLLLRRTFGTSIVLVTHNIGLVGAMADNVLVLKDGEAVEYGKTQQVLQAPENTYTKKLMSAVPRLKRQKRG